MEEKRQKKMEKERKRSGGHRKEENAGGKEVFGWKGPTAKEKKGRGAKSGR